MKRQIKNTLILIVLSFVPLIYMASRTSITYNIPKDYSEIFGNNVNNLEFIAAFQCRNKNPLLEFKYKRNYLFVYKLNGLYTDKLQNILQTSTNEKLFHESLWYTFSLVKLPLSSIDQHIFPLRSTGNIVANFGGESFQQVINEDSTIGYRLLLQCCTIKYAADESSELIIDSKDSHRKICASFIFMKRKANLYCLISAPIYSNNDTVDFSQLTQLIKN